VAQILHELIYKVCHRSYTNLYTKCGTDPARTYIQSSAQILYEPVYKVWDITCTNLYTKCGTNPVRTYIQSAAQILYEPVYKVWDITCTNIYTKCGTNPIRTYIQSVAQILYEPVYKVLHKSHTNLCTKCCTNPTLTCVQSVAQIPHEPLQTFHVFIPSVPPISPLVMWPTVVSSLCLTEYNYEFFKGDFNRLTVVEFRTKTQSVVNHFLYSADVPTFLICFCDSSKFQNAANSHSVKNDNSSFESLE
jgi:hypothetical protein